ncbi:hypothetical protein [Microbacterium sp. NPDC056569]|uniref:hypothetical protein n=1 Tax=Microbacterium sp. NPDC056569 TaxID=3345867 RepID=UPI00366F3B5D
MPALRKRTFKALTGALIAAALVVAPLVTAGATAAEPVLKGEVGKLEPATPEGNAPGYWEKLTEHTSACYKVDGPWSSSHGTISSDKKTITLKPYQAGWWGDHWELLIIKAGTTNNVIKHPQAGVAYASPANNGGNQADVSHWIVCKGKTPDTPQPEKPSQDLDCTTIVVDYHRALKNGDHINITYAEGKQVNAYVDQNIAGGWNGLGLRFSDGSTKPLTEAEVTSGVITWQYSSLIPGKDYTISFVQTNETDTWPELECEGEDEPTVVTPALTFTEPTCKADGTVTPGDGVTWTSVKNADGTTTWTATPKAGTKFADGVQTEWIVPSLLQLAADSEACRPAQPEPEQTSTLEFDYDCASTTVTTKTTTTTTPYEWDGKSWVLGESSSEVKTEKRPMTAAEKKECPLPDKKVENSPWVDGAWDCGDTTVTQTREVTTTVYTYDEQGTVTPTVTKTEETQTRALSSDEVGEVCDLVPGEILSTCVGDVPFLGYEVMLPEGYEAEADNPVTITFVNPDGEDFVADAQPLSGVLLWPGASNGTPKMWPGWEIVDGEYVKTAGNYDWTRKGVTVRFEVNPSYSTEVFYPEASAECANPPVGGGDDPSGTPTSTDSQALAATGGGISPMFAVAGGAALIAGIAIVAFAAYRRRQSAS